MTESNEHFQQLAKWYIGYGIFLGVCGIAGYLSNPEGAKTAIITGSAFGGLAVLTGGLFHMKLRVGYVALGLTVLLLGAFSWRATVGWQQTLAGEDKLFAAILISAMWVASLISLVVLFRRRAVAFPGARSVA